MPSIKTLPLSVGIETTGGVLTKLMLRGTPLPGRRIKRFSTTGDAAISVSVVAGERSFSVDNLQIAQLELEAPAVPSKGKKRDIEIAIEVDIHCALNATVKDISSGQIAAALSNTLSKLDEATVQRVLADAAANKLADNARLAIAEAEMKLTKTQGDRPGIEKAISELGLALTEGESIRISDLTAELVTATERTGDPLTEIFGSFLGQTASSSPRSGGNPKTATSKPASGSVFLVHGRDSARTQLVARFLERMVGNVTILAEEANKGRTVIEKFEQSARNASFAVVLLTGDDFGGFSGEATSKPAQRARQNVVLELGFFIGAIGRGRVCPLYESGVELPSDYLGIAYVSLVGDWQLQLARELKAAGFPIDINKIL